MKKLFAIIGVLLLIFIFLLIYRINLKNNRINIQDVEKIQQYISKIYMWKEVTGEALPKFDNVNDAPYLWIWEVVKRNFEDYEISYDDIEYKATEIFGSNIDMKFIDQDLDYIEYDTKTSKYINTGFALDTIDDSFIIKDIKKTREGYEVDIIEYLEDYGQKDLDENRDFDINIENLNNDIVEVVKESESESRIIDIVKENSSKFSMKSINLIKDPSGSLVIESVE